MISKDSVIAPLLFNDAMRLEVVRCVSKHFTGNRVYPEMKSILVIKTI
jgi:hypothetical protein